MTAPLTERMGRKGPLLLAASLAFNLIAITLLLTRWQNHEHQVSQALPPPSAMVSHAADAPSGMDETAASHPPPTEPFHWQKLDAPDFPTFVANLRAIGCPETTIRDIVTGELKEIYNLRTNEVMAGGSSTPDTGFVAYLPPGGNAAGEAGTGEIESVLDQVLGTSADTPKTDVAVIAEAPVTPPVSPAVTTVTDVADVPAAFLVGNASGQSLAGASELATAVTDPTLAPETAEQLNRMRTEFAVKVADATAATSASAATNWDYYRRWLKAKRDSDEVFSSMYGGDALIRVQQQALLESSAQQAGTPLAR